MQVGRGLHHAQPVVLGASFADRVGFGEAVTRAERLPLEREQAMALQIAEGAVVGQDVEPVRRALECAARAMTAIGAVPDVGAEQRRSLVDGHAARDAHELIVGEIRDGVERRGDDLDLAVGIEVGQRDLGPRFRRVVVEERRGERCGLVARVGQVRRSTRPPRSG